MTVTNNGPHKAYSVSLADTIPPGTAFVSVTPLKRAGPAQLRRWVEREL